jgi:hypothetical protein
MSQIFYRANTAAASVPFNGIDGIGQPVIIAGPDQNFSRQTAARADQDRSVGIPQAYYLRNVMPIEGGYAAAISGIEVGSGFTQLAPDSVYLPCYNIGGVSGSTISQMLILQQESLGTISLHRPFPPSLIAATDGTTSSWILNGTTYFYRNNGSTQEVYLITTAGTKTSLGILSGLSSSVIDMSGAFGYNLAITAQTFFWSSTTDPLDFTASLTSGSGSFKIQQALGNLRCIIPGSTGVYVVAEYNIIFLRYTGNPQFPFAAQVVENSGPLKGGADSNSRTAESIILDKARCSDCFIQSDEKWIVTQTGVFRLTPRVMIPEFGELTQWIRGHLGLGAHQIPRISGSNYDLSPQTAYTDITHVHVAADNYVCFRFNHFVFVNGGPSIFVPAMWVYDQKLQRWGNLDNWALFYDYRIFGGPAPGNSVLFRLSGTVNYRTATPNGIQAGVYNGTMVLGKYQHARSRMLELHSVDVPPMCTVRALCSLDGQQISAVREATLSTGAARRFFQEAVGMNISICIEGAFALPYMTLGYSLGAKSQF